MKSETLNQFRKLVLEKLHGCSYDEALRAELKARITRVKPNKTVSFDYKTREIISGFENVICGKITIGRLMAVLVTGVIEDFYLVDNEGDLYRTYDGDLDSLGIRWKLLREDKTEADETNQTPETIEALIKILAK